MPELNDDITPELYDDITDTGDSPSYHATNADDLEDLADLMEGLPWTRGQLLDPETGGVCLMGGATLLAYGTVYPDEIQYLPSQRDHVRLHRLNRALLRGLSRLETPPFRFSITAWNDDEGRTKEQVLDLIRDTAKYERMKAEQLETERKSTDE